MSSVGFIYHNNCDFFEALTTDTIFKSQMHSSKQMQRGWRGQARIIIYKYLSTYGTLYTIKQTKQSTLRTLLILFLDIDTKKIMPIRNLLRD